MMKNQTLIGIGCLSLVDAFFPGAYRDAVSSRRDVLNSSLPSLL
jgi:hypothetical protein